MLQNYFNASGKSSPHWLVPMILACLFSGTAVNAFTVLKTSSISTSVLVPGDNDNDGILDANDLDDDNDGILDTDEGKDAIDHDLIWLTRFPDTNVNGNALYQSFSSPIILDNKDTYNSDVTMNFTMVFNGGYAENPTPSSSGNIGGGSGETQEKTADGGQPNGIEYLVDWHGGPLYVNDPTQYVTYTYEFSKAVRLNNFDFKDIDRQDEYIDALKIKAYINVGGVDVEVPLNATRGSRITTWNDPWNPGDFFYHATTNTNAPKTDARNFVVFNSGDFKITKIVITATTAMGSYDGIPDTTSRFMFGDFIISTDIDTDIDGIPDFQDNDSDNDSCADAVEAAGTFTTSNIDTNGQLTGGVALNGIPTLAGTGQATSANVTIASKVVIEVNPTDKSVVPGANTNFGVDAKYTATTTYTGIAPNTTPDYSASTASTTGMIYQWQVDKGAGAGFENIIDDAIYTGAMSDALTLTAVPSTMDGYKYQVIITNPNYSCANLTSTTATLKIGGYPVAVNDTATTNEDTAVIINVVTNPAGLDTDADGSINAATVDLDPSTPTIDSTFSVIGQGTYAVDNLGNVTFTPALNYNGTATAINYTVQDNTGLTSNIATLTITVTAVNDAPIAVDDAITAIEDTLFTSVIELDANDTDVDTAILSVVAGTFTTTQGGTLVLSSNGSYTYTPALNYNGADSYNYTVTDGNLTDIGTLNITVTPVNDAPVAVNNAATTEENIATTTNVTSNDTDVDGSINVATVDLDPSTPTIDSTFSLTGEGTYTVDNLGNVTFTPATDFIGTSTINYTVQDNSGLTSNSATITITVTKKVVEHEIVVFNAMTPNGDGENDNLQIKNIEFYPNNSIQIYNRWGVLVFETKGYNNTDKVFKGFSEGRVTIKESAGLPAGTYFYAFQYTDNAAVTHDKSGYLYISK